MIIIFQKNRSQIYHLIAYVTEKSILFNFAFICLSSKSNILIYNIFIMP